MEKGINFDGLCAPDFTPLPLDRGCLCPWLLSAAQFSGQVRAADQIVPGATVTALQGGAKVTAFTDENGRYTLELTPGVWQIEVSMFEFTTAKGQVTIGDGGVAKDWVLNMPKLSERGGPAAAAGASAAAPLPAAPGIGRGARGARGNRGADGQGGQRGYGNYPGTRRAGRTNDRRRAGRSGRPRTGQGRGGAAGQAQGGFQSAAVRATPEGQQANAQQQDAQQNIDLSGDADESLLVNGSVSGGLEQSSDDEARRQRAMAGRGGPVGGRTRRPGGGAVSAAQGLQMTAGLPPGMTASLTNDSLGLGGFGASAINGGFGIGAAAPPDGGGGGRGGGGLAWRGWRSPGGFGGGAGGGFGGGGGGGGARRRVGTERQWTRTERTRRARSVQRTIRQHRQPAAHHAPGAGFDRDHGAQFGIQCGAVFAERTDRAEAVLGQQHSEREYRRTAAHSETGELAARTVHRQLRHDASIATARAWWGPCRRRRSAGAISRRR